MLQVKIEKLVAGGRGLARLDDGMVALIPNVIPGELVEITPVKKHKKLMEADLVRVIEPSPHRVEPQCRHYNSCGGCDLQHIEYGRQVEYKNDILSEQLVRSKVFSADQLARIEAPLPAPFPFNYRQRVRYHVSDGEYGFFRHHSHELKPVDSCPLAHPALNDVLDTLSDNTNFLSLLTDTKEFELQLSPVDKEIIIVFHRSRKTRKAEIKKARILITETKLNAVLVKIPGQALQTFTEEGQGPARISFKYPLAQTKELAMQLEAGGFCQVNLDQNLQLIDHLLAWVSASQNDSVLDLFCGMGNFSIPLATMAGKVMGMDLQRSAIRSAKKNASINKLDNCTFAQSYSVKGIKELAGSDHSFGLLLLDPPRSGCAEVIPHIPSLKPDRIIYISCDPATLCRDLTNLQQKGYLVDKVKMFDMFPQTHHMETMVLLSASS